MTTQYHHDYAAFDENVLCAPFMVAEMLKRAERVKLRAEVTAPFYADDVDGEHYKDDFDVTAGIRETPTRRAYGRVTNDNSAAVLVEFGRPAGIDKNGKHYGAQERHRTLGNALDAAGD